MLWPLPSRNFYLFVTVHFFVLNHCCIGVHVHYDGLFGRGFLFLGILSDAVFVMEKRLETSSFLSLSLSFFVSFFLLQSLPPSYLYFSLGCYAFALFRIIASEIAQFPLCCIILSMQFPCLWLDSFWYSVVVDVWAGDFRVDDWEGTVGRLSGACYETFCYTLMYCLLIFPHNSLST